VKQKEVMERWGLPFADVALSAAANGLSMRDAARVVDMSYNHFREIALSLGITQEFESSYKLSSIAAQYKESAWAVIGRMADKGMTRKAVAAELGYNESRFNAMLAANPGKDPFPSWLKAAAYVAESGETIVSASRRLAAEGKTANGAARIIGYANGAGLLEALQSRGVKIEFAPPPVAAPKVKKVKRLWVEKGGPKMETWRQRQEREYRQWAVSNERV
jgi:hypothetical protein